MSGERTCFVIMPYGVKTTASGESIDFDSVYTEIIEEPLKAAGLNYIRCDHIQQAGVIGRDMFEHIAYDDVAIVDITTLNANVFYELGARHALQPGVTILIRRRDSSPIPFNIQDLRVIEYPSASGSFAESREQIRRFVENGLRSGSVDSPILTLIRPREAPDKSRRIINVESHAYRLKRDPRRQIVLLTGDIQEHRDIDVWVNSENTNMQMARFYDRGMSALIRYLGAAKDDNQNIVEDTIATELAAVMRGRESVAPGTVFSTSPGALKESHGLKRIFHAAAVVGTPGAGYVAIPDVDRCVTGALRLADADSMRQYGLRSIAFPMMGTGTAGADLKRTAAQLLQAAISYLVANPRSGIERVCFLAWNERDLDACRAVLDAADDTERVQR